MTLKSRVHAACVESIGARIRMLESELDELKSQLGSDSKSSAGDKHETGRAMIHLEQEQLARQLYEFNLQFSLLNASPSDATPEPIRTGALIETSSGYFYLNIGLGKLKIDEIEVIAISPQSPLGSLFLGRRAGDQLVLNTKTITILSVS